MILYIVCGLIIVHFVWRMICSTLVFKDFIENEERIGDWTNLMICGNGAHVNYLQRKNI